MCVDGASAFLPHDAQMMLLTDAVTKHAMDPLAFRQKQYSCFWFLSMQIQNRLGLRMCVVVIVYCSVAYALDTKYWSAYLHTRAYVAFVDMFLHISIISIKLQHASGLLQNGFCDEYLVKVGQRKSLLFAPGEVMHAPKCQHGGCTRYSSSLRWICCVVIRNYYDPAASSFRSALP